MTRPDEKLGRELPYIGFAALRPGRIHLYCGRCGRKQSNARRERHDPPTAVIAEFWCPQCDAGCKANDPVFRDARGRVVTESA